MSGTWIPRPALDLVRKWEGLYRVGADGLVYPYLCPAGVWTIGWGTTKGINKDTKPWTKAECDLRMVQDLARFTLDVYRLCPAILDASDIRIGALVSWTYNLGSGNLAASTFRKRINTQDWKAGGRVPQVEHVRRDCVSWTGGKTRTRSYVYRTRLKC